MASLGSKGESALISRVRRLEQNLSELIAAVGAVNSLESDRDLQLGAVRSSIAGSRGDLREGVIVASLPSANSYRVLMDGTGRELICGAVSELSENPLSVRANATLPPRTAVLVWEPEGAPFGFILCVLPVLNNDPSRSVADWIVQGGQSGVNRERYYREIPQLLERGGGFHDFSADRPGDATAVGEWSRFTPLGGGLFIDSFMLFLRQSEVCGLWAFYHDQLLRLAGQNFDLFTGGGERIVRLDQGELYEMIGDAVYPWEAVGAYAEGESSVAEQDDAAVLFNEPVAKFEPEREGQTAFYRRQQYGGYLGQGGFRQVVAPLALQGLKTNGASPEEATVFRETISVAGDYTLQASRSLFLIKRPPMVTPRQTASPEDAGGDDETAYKFSGMYGEGEEHAVRASLNYGDDRPHLLSAAAVMDAVVYRDNWESLHPFRLHTKDFHTPQPSDLSAFSRRRAPISFGELSDNQYLPPPATSTVEVDHRYGEVVYHHNDCIIGFTEDGGLLIRDGYGSEIRGVAGSLHLSSPGDVIVQPGRSLISYAGDDTVLRSRNSVDITSSHKDVRLKAEHNLELLGGNETSGRVLVECRAPGASHEVFQKFGEDVDQSGLILKAAKSEILQWGSSIYLRTGGGGELGDGGITLDAGQGERSIRGVASDVAFHVDTGLSIALPTGEPETTHYFGKEVAYLPTAVGITGPAYVLSGGVYARGNIAGIQCSIFCDRNESGLLGVHDSNDESYTQIEESIEDFEARFTEWSNNLSDQFTQGVDEAFWSEGRGGADAVILNSAFSPRTAEQMRTQEWSTPQAYWQQLAGNTGGVPWVEPPITYQKQEMAPHPGLAAWREGHFQQVVHALHEFDDQTDAAVSSSTYAEGNPTWDASASPETHYRVIA